MNYGKFLSKKNTPQSEALLGEPQIKNNAGGYSYEVSKWDQLNRFLTLGTVGGTIYVSEKDLTKSNAEVLTSLIKEDGLRVVSTLTQLVAENRVPKMDTAVFLLALASTHGDVPTKALTYNVISKVCRNSTQLFGFLNNIQELRGWSRGLRTGVSKFYTSKTPEQVAYQLVKYRQRDGWTHKDVLRLAHPKSTELNSLFQYTVGKPPDNTDEANVPNIVIGYELAKLPITDEALVSVIKEYNLTWEMIPTESLNKKIVLEALLPKMPLTALLRNLNRFTNAGVFGSRTDVNTKLAIEKLTSTEQIANSNLHPINVLNTLKVYESGTSVLGNKLWTPNQAIVDALQETFELSFMSVVPSGKKLLVAVDVSGSMNSPNVAKLALSPKEVAAALTSTLLKSEKDVEVMYFTDKAIEAKIGKRSSYKEVLESTRITGNTDCAVPFTYATKKKLNVDAIIVLTDSETWAGSTHPVFEFNEYRKRVNPNVKGIVVAMVANRCTLFAENDKNCLNVSGFDAGIPALINQFVKE